MPTQRVRRPSLWSHSTKVSRFSPSPPSTNSLRRKPLKRFESTLSRFLSSSIRSIPCDPAAPTPERKETSGCRLPPRRRRQDLGRPPPPPPPPAAAQSPRQNTAEAKDAAP